MTKENFAAIIIGSGIGGLSCAASLAMCKYKVLVLEKNLSPGGSMSSFTEPETGNWTWLPGVQWVCDYSENSDEYKQITEQITQSYLNHLNEKFPGIIEYVKYSKLITPLDVKNLTHHNNGSMFGLDIQKADNPELSPRSGIKNLFFTGEDIFSHGLTPLNGVITASVVTGKNLIARFKKTHKLMNKK